MKLIGLTGGIGSGKSTVARQLEEHGWPVIDADALARAVVEPGAPALTELAKAFGQDIIASDGTLNRALLAHRAFAHAESTARLNQITHPHIAAQAARKFEQLRQAGHEYAVYDMPLLIEQGLDKDMDAVIVVHAPEETRIERLVSVRGLTASDVRNRMKQQATDAQRLAAATHVIDNSGTPAKLRAQVADVIAQIERAD